VVSKASLETAKPSKYHRKTQTPRGVRFTPPPPPPPRYARPIGGPRVSSAAWHRLGCLLRGTTRPRLCTPVGSCMHLPGAGVWCAYSGHLLLGAPTRRVERFSQIRTRAMTHEATGSLPYRGGGEGHLRVPSITTRYRLFGRPERIPMQVTLVGFVKLPLLTRGGRR
jgi:hypothetical protein